tara:strand:+ start:63 stop:1415 length:1353 start_codon:yes stop_codon:yes gene_type:complete
MKLDHKIIYISLLIFIVLKINTSFSQEKKLNVLLVEIKQNIDPRINRYTKLMLEEVEKKDYDMIIIEMDTYGGALNDADDIRTRILDFDKPIYSWINKDAASAGALISIACDSIYMSSGASIGAATVVTADGNAAPDKYQSYMRSIMRSTAEAKNRDPNIAEAMVDQDVKIDSLSQEGKVITFSTSEAIKNGFCEAEINSIDELMNHLNYDNYEINKFQLSSTENIISFFLNPMISSVLILIILGGIYFELQTPGVGFPIMAAIIAGILYLTPYYLNGLAENWEILMFLVGIILIGIEIFVIPGFGFFGILGLLFTISSLVLIMVNNDFLDFTFVFPTELFNATGSVLLAVLGFIVLLFFGGVKISESQYFKKISLDNIQDSDKGFTSKINNNDIIGKKGKSFTILRPSGKVIIENKIFDASTSGEYIDKNKNIEVVENEGTSIKVKQIT